MNERYAKLFDLTGKVAFLAGGSGAIGGEIARAAAAYGARVVVAGRSQERCAQVVETIHLAGGQAISVGLDLRRPDSVAEAVAVTEATCGPLHGLVNAAGAHIEKAAADVSLETWDTILGVNLGGAFLLSQAAARSMITHHTPDGIVHLTSVRSALGIRRGYAAYVASKGGLEACPDGTRRTPLPIRQSGEWQPSLA